MLPSQRQRGTGESPDKQLKERDSRSSEDPVSGATLMYRCPISAFNWPPRGPTAESGTGTVSSGRQAKSIHLCDCNHTSPLKEAP